MPDKTPAGSTPEPGAERITRSIPINGIAMVRLLGPQDRLLTRLEREYPYVDVHVRGNEVTLTGAPSEVAAIHALMAELIVLVERGHNLEPEDITESVRISENGHSVSDLLGETILQTRGKIVRPKTQGQHEYVQAIDENTIVFGIGPAGTGKTYLAMAKAVQALMRKEVTRIILTRPAVEAGERLGFLPGTLTDKIDPYLRPLYDALNDFMDPELVPKLLAAGTVEVAPLAYMRGRTLNDAFIVLDEAQNTTPEQMKMFLTRLGFNSKMIVTGDITQIDLPTAASGLRLVTKVLADIDDIHFARLTSADVVRHSLVGEIVDAYSQYDERKLAERFEREQAAEFAQRATKRSGSGGPTGRNPRRPVI